MSGSARLILRSLLVEAAFSPRGRQTGGYLWMAGLAIPREELTPPVNTNPVLIGGLLAFPLEGDPVLRERRASASAALAALGDRLVWATLRPLAIAAALLAAAAGPIQAAAALLLVYNPPELLLRARAIRRGLAGPEPVLADLAGGTLSRAAKVGGRLGSVAVGFLIGFWMLDLGLDGRIPELGIAIGGLGISVCLLRSGRRGAWGAAGLALLLGIVWQAAAGIGN